MKLTAFGGYWRNITITIAPYFREKGILLKNLTADDINDHYDERYKTVKPATVEKQHANIHSALKYAVIISHSVMDNVDRPNVKSTTQDFSGSWKRWRCLRRFRVTSWN